MATRNPKVVAPIDLDVLEAAQEYLDLQSRAKHPEGYFDNAKRWYPDEPCPCCQFVREPTRSWPFSLMVHCRTAEHVAFKHGLDALALKRAARVIRKTNEAKADATAH